MGNIENQFRREEDPEWSTYGGEKIKADIKLKLNVGNENTADMKFNGELSEAAKEFVTNGYLAALNAKMEFCDDNKECTRIKICAIHFNQIKIELIPVGIREGSDYTVFS